jgi:hypothetical protein
MWLVVDVVGAEVVLKDVVGHVSMVMVIRIIQHGDIW